MSQELKQAIAEVEEELNRLLSLLDRAQRGEASALRRLGNNRTTMLCRRAFLVVDVPDVLSQAVRRAHLDALPTVGPPTEREKRQDGTEPLTA